MGRTSSYPAAFRTEAVRLVLHTNKTAAQVARDLGISPKTLSNWVRAERDGLAQAAEPGAISESEREELRRLRKETTSFGSSARSCARRPPISPRRRPGEPLPVRRGPSRRLWR
jgi:transposase